jgi:hypothetical protein
VECFLIAPAPHAVRGLEIFNHVVYSSLPFFPNVQLKIGGSTMPEAEEFVSNTPTVQGVPVPLPTFSIATRLTDLAHESFMLYSGKPIVVVRRVGKTISMILGIGTDKPIVQLLNERGYEIPVARYVTTDDDSNIHLVNDSIVIKLHELDDPPQVAIFFGEEEILANVRNAAAKEQLSILASEIGFVFGRTGG